MMKAGFLVVAAGALVLAACDSAGADETPTARAPLATPLASPAATAAATAQAFADTAASGDAYEIAAGRLAQAMGKSPNVRAFGAMMVQDHAASTASLKAAAARIAGVTIDPRITALQQNKLDALRGAGSSFDTVYAQQQVAAHELALHQLRDYAASGDAAPLKAFAGDAIAGVESHLVKARALP
jgi:putative membrane protein